MLYLQEEVSGGNTQSRVLRSFRRIENVIKNYDMLEFLGQTKDFDVTLGNFGNGGMRYTKKHKTEWLKCEGRIFNLKGKRKRQLYKLLTVKGIFNFEG